MRATSVETYRQIRPELAGKQLRVYNAIRELKRINGKACTNKEIASYLNVPINEVTGRTRELFEKEKVIEAGVIIDSNTNKPNTLWDIV